MTKLSVVIPTMNEERSIGLVMDAIYEAISGKMDYEILIVDTDSQDRTREIATEKGARIIDEPRRGYGRAYKTGFESSTGELICTLDADMTYPADRIPDLVHRLEEEKLEFITTDRLTELVPGVMSATHRLGNRLLSIATRLLFRVRIRDSQSGMWVFRRDILPRLNLVSDGMAFSEELKIEAFRKTRAKEIPIKYSPRVGEVKLNTWKDGVSNMRYLFRKRFRRSHYRS